MGPAKQPGEGLLGPHQWGREEVHTRSNSAISPALSKARYPFHYSTAAPGSICSFMEPQRPSLMWWPSWGASGDNPGYQAVPSIVFSACCVHGDIIAKWKLSFSGLLLSSPCYLGANYAVCWVCLCSQACTACSLTICLPVASVRRDRSVREAIRR